MQKKNITEIVDKNPNFLVNLSPTHRFAVSAKNSASAIDRVVEYVERKDPNSDLLVLQEEYDAIVEKVGENVADDYCRYCNGVSYVLWENVRVKKLTLEESKKLSQSKKLNENKKPKTLVENIQNIKKNYKLLKEYMDFAEGDVEQGFGDQALDADMKEMDGGLPNTKQFIINIMKNSLSAMQQLADNAESDEFKALKAIFDQCQKYNTQQEKQSEPLQEENSSGYRGPKQPGLKVPKQPIYAGPLWKPTMKDYMKAYREDDEERIEYLYNELKKLQIKYKDPSPQDIKYQWLYSRRSPDYPDS